jgi:hypothetical protein
MTRKITPTDAGCWIDEINGWHAHYQVAELALSLGWLTSKDPAVPLPGYASTPRRKRAETRARRSEVRAVLAAYKGGQDTARYRQAEIDDVPGQVINQGGICDQATDYLSTLAPEGFSFGWHEGNLMLMSNEWWSEG